MKGLIDLVSNTVRHVLGTKKARVLLVSLAAVVVFITTYMLILPALTLDNKEADKQGGINTSVESEKEEVPQDEVIVARPSTPTYKTGELSYNGKSFDIEASFDEKAKLPENTQLKVKEIDKDSKQYADYYAKALEAVNQDAETKVSELAFAKFYDIALRTASADIEPSDAVDVKISYDNGLAAKDADHVRVLHFKEDSTDKIVKTEVLNPEDVDVTIKNEKMTEAAFEAESFSVYAVVYTVDFHYDANGKTYDFGIPGGGFVSLEQVADALRISNDAKAFVADVKKVEFSNPELVWTGKVETKTTVGALKETNNLDVEYSADLDENQIDGINAQTIESGDWALISLKPFDTEETLTITMKNGDEFAVKVTDSSYTSDDITDQVLNGHTGALVNIYNNNVLQSSRHRVSGRLNAVGIVYDQSAHTISTVNAGDRITEWTFTKVNNTNLYYIHSSAGYLNMNINGNSGLTVSETPQAFVIERNNSNGTIRIKHPDNNNAVNNFNNNTNDGYGVWGSGDTGNRGEQFKLIELSNATETIALSPMNENGILQGNPDSGNVTSTHYKKMTIDGYLVDDNDNANLDKARIYIPVQYNSDGTATITLPSNSQLSSFSVTGTDSHSIIQSNDKYQWTLHGWYDIATKTYYDTTNGPVTVTVNQGDLNVFYADWWATDYNYTIPEDQLADTADTSSFVNIKMWDYNELYNLQGSDVWKVDGDTRKYIPRDSISSEEWYIKNGPYFQFVDNTDPGNCWQYGSLGNTQDRGRYNQWSNYSNSGTLGILGEQGQLPSTGVLETLFPASVTPGSGVNYLGQGNYFFHYDKNTKTYSYDSNINGAVYNQEEERFYVSNSPRNNHWRGGGGGYREDVGFFPLNDAESRIEYNNGTTNNWFGMSMELDFWLPDTPGSSNDANKIAGHPMRFEFTGDDDVWVLIDGKLALDIGGIHEAVSGYIDFSTGEIRNAKGDTYQLSDMGIGAGAHTLSFYYLEQGGNASNCKITFNITPRWVEEPEHYGVVHVTKTWSEDTPEEAKHAVTFSLQTADGTPVAGTTVGYDDGIETDGVWKYTWEGLDPNQDYEVVEEADPRFVAISQHDTDVSENCWAAASYHKDNAFGSSTILIGNGKTSSEGGRLLNGNGSSDNTDIVDYVVKSTVNNSVQWTVEGYSQTDQHFYLKNSSGSYLSIKNGSIAFVNTAADASWFYMSPSGDLNDANSDYRLKVNSDGLIGVGAIVNSADETDINSSDRIHVYTYYAGVFSKTINYDNTNTYQTTDITVRKEWSDSPEVDHSQDTITIALYQYAIGSDGQIVAETEYPITAPNTDIITGNGTNTIRNLPVAGVYEGQIVTYEYHVAEKHGKEGYIAQIDHPGDDYEHWTITNIPPDEQDKTTSVNLTKNWRHPDGTDAASDHVDDEITFKLLQRAVGSDYVPVTMRWGNNISGVIEENYYIRKGESFVFTVSKPDTLLPHGVSVTTTRGTGDSDSWSSDSAGTHTFTISNITDAITINARLTFLNDEWGDSASWLLQRWGHSVQTGNLLTDVNSVVSSDEDNDTIAGYPTEYLYTLHSNDITDGVFDESAANWVASLKDLPLYKKIGDGTYYSYYYTISEISVNGESVLPNSTTATGQSDNFTVVIDQENMTITNTEKEKTEAEADKAWLNADGTDTPPADASVVFELYADGESTGKIVKLNGKKDVPENPGNSEETIAAAGNSEHAYESAAWKAYWDDLQKYTYNEDGTRTDHVIVYTIKEVPESIPEGYAADYGKDGETPKAEAASGGTITNVQLAVPFEIIKVDAAGMITPLEGALFELRRIDPDTGEYLVDDPTLPTTTGTDHKTGSDGKATFEGLISGYYEVEEAEAPAGYIRTGDGKFYIKVENGEVSLVERAEGGTWIPSYGDDTLVFTHASGNKPASVKVGNTAGAELPFTGGRGTTLLYLLGLALVLTAGGALMIRRRRIAA